jgi:spore maturation protein CgeB
VRIAILGLSITSSWGNGHATCYRGLVRELAAAGHDVLFLERDVPWYAASRDLPAPPWGRTHLYTSLDDLKARFTDDVRGADLVVVGSYIPEGVAVGRWVLDLRRNGAGPTAFYDIDTPVTLAKLERGDEEYLSRGLVRRYDLYLSFTGGPTLERLEKVFASPSAQPLYCAFDPELYFPDPDARPAYDLGYMGTYSDDRQPTVEALLNGVARVLPDRRFVCAGPQYPDEIDWPANVERVEHLPPAEHRAFYNAQRWTLNVTRADMIRAGWSPSVRLFEAAACATPIISDIWPGIGDFFKPGEEIILARTTDDVLRCLTGTPDDERHSLGERARRRVLSAHTAAHRAQELVGYARALGV